MAHCIVAGRHGSSACILPQSVSHSFIVPIVIPSAGPMWLYLTNG
jgi:hypothetical protein